MKVGIYRGKRIHVCVLDPRASYDFDASDDLKLLGETFWDLRGCHVTMEACMASAHDAYAFGLLTGLMEANGISRTLVEPWDWCSKYRIAYDVVDGADAKACLRRARKRGPGIEFTADGAKAFLLAKYA